MGTPQVALIVSICSALVASFSLILHFVKHGVDIDRERGSINDKYNAVLDVIEDKLHRFIAVKGASEFDELIISVSRLTTLIRIHFSWKPSKVKNAYGKYRQFVQSEDRGGLGLHDWSVRGFDKELEQLRENLLIEINMQLQKGRVLKRIRKGRPVVLRSEWDV